MFSKQNLHESKQTLVLNTLTKKPSKRSRLNDQDNKLTDELSKTVVLTSTITKNKEAKKSKSSKKYQELKYLIEKPLNAFEFDSNKVNKTFLNLLNRTPSKETKSKNDQSLQYFQYTDKIKIDKQNTELSNRNPMNKKVVTNQVQSAFKKEGKTDMVNKFVKQFETKIKSITSTFNKQNVRKNYYVNFLIHNYIYIFNLEKGG